MKNFFLTITAGFKFHGIDIFSPGMIVKLVKEPDNPKDSEAIKVLLPGDIPAGYVANSVHTVTKGTYSAGRIYDKFEDEAFAKVLFVTERVAIAVFLGYEEKLSKLFSELKPIISPENTDFIENTSHDFIQKEKDPENCLNS